MAEETRGRDEGRAAMGKVPGNYMWDTVKCRSAGRLGNVETKKWRICNLMGRETERERECRTVTSYSMSWRVLRSPGTL